MKVVTRVKSLLAAAVAAAGLVAFAEPVVEITKAWQANPGSGTIDFTYEVRNLEGVGAWAYDVIVRVEAKGCENTFTFTNENVSAGSVTTNIDYKAMLGQISPNVSIYASLEKRPGGVQLWENGPYFAECNVGAEKAEEPGYYFWWGDTNGCVRIGNSWKTVDGTVENFSFKVGCAPTAGQDADNLKVSGWIGEDGCLVPEHDAATAYLGAPWRMPTPDDLHALTNNCTLTWTTQGTASGFFVQGKGDYATKNIFLPAAGVGQDNELMNLNTWGVYWTSMPSSEEDDRTDHARAWNLYFDSQPRLRVDAEAVRRLGRCVRPVRDAAE